MYYRFPKTPILFCLSYIVPAFIKKSGFYFKRRRCIIKKSGPCAGVRLKADLRPPALRHPQFSINIQLRPYLGPPPPPRAPRPLPSALPCHWSAPSLAARTRASNSALALDTRLNVSHSARRAIGDEFGPDRWGAYESNTYGGTGGRGRRGGEIEW